MAGPDRKLAAWTQLRGYPLKNPALGPLVEAEGAVITPRDQTRGEIGYELLLGYRVIDDETITWRSTVEVVYRVGDQEYLWRSPARLVYCPRDLKSDECRAEAERNSYAT